MKGSSLVVHHCTLLSFLFFTFAIASVIESGEMSSRHPFALTNTLLSKQVWAPLSYFSFVPSVIPIAIGRTYTNLLLKQVPLPIGLRRHVVGNGLQTCCYFHLRLRISLRSISNHYSQIQTLTSCPLDDPTIHSQKKPGRFTDRAHVKTYQSWSIIKQILKTIYKTMRS